MKLIFRGHKYSLLIVLIFILSEVFVNPCGEFPLNDDWSYTKSVLIFLKEGVVHIGNWPSMTLLTHILWGAVFVKVAGFSFFILRLSTIISSLTGILVLNKLVADISGNKACGFIASLTLMFYPVYFNLSNTFMTDVNFNTLMIIGGYCAFHFFRNGRQVFFGAALAVALLLTFLRQYGVIFPVCLGVACVFKSRNKWLYASLSLVGLLLIMALLNYYENYLKGILSPEASYRFSGNIHPFKSEFRDFVLVNIQQRYRPILINLLLYTFPFALSFIPYLFMEFRGWFVLICGVNIYLSYVLLIDEPLLMGNVFVNMSLGSETFFENFNHINEPIHTFSPMFESICNLVKYTVVPVSFSVIILLVTCLLRHVRFTGLKFGKLSSFVFFVATVVAYEGMVLITESHFDRYHIPVVTAIIILFSFATRIVPVNWKVAIVPLLLYFYISVAGSKDYFALNRNRWQAYNDLRKEGVAHHKINGGFEVDCWNEGQFTWYSMFLELKGFDYLIQYRPEPGFVLYRTYEFQRYFPFKKDKINIFVRKEKSKVL
jgi:hypothetical protein